MQPAEPLELWKSGPFEPVIVDGKILPVAVGDDKGQFYMHVKSAGNNGKTNTLTTNIKILY